LPRGGARRRAYTAPVSRLAASLREEDRQRVRRMTPDARLHEALALGEEAVAVYAAAHGLDPLEARRTLERASQKGRRPSRVMAATIG
jgi:hypothetical protein